LHLDQTRLDVFAAVTDDLEPLHNDAEWCERNSPYGRPIAHGFLTLSLLTRFMHEATAGVLKGRADGAGYPVNYGFDRVRFLAPVPVGSRIRCRLVLAGREERGKATMLRIDASVEIEGRADRPALEARWLLLWVEGA
jgi:acyl dehydratase